MKIDTGHEKSISIRHFLFVMLFPLIVLFFGSFIGEFSTEMIARFTIGLLLMVAFGVVGLGYGQIKGYGISRLDLFPFILAILAWAMQGASEEIIMRGYMFNDLKGKSNISLALIISSTYFAWLHLSNNGITPLSFINIILAGLFFAFYYLKEGSLWGACGFHSAWNFAQENLLGLPVSGHRIGGGSLLELKLQEQEALIAGGPFGLEGSIVCTGVLALGILILCLRLKKKQ